MLFTSLLMALAATTMTADTLVVDHAMVEGPYAVARPYATDSLNMKGEAYFHIK